MPVLAFDLASDLPRVQRWDPQTGKALLARQPYVRLSPWDPRVRQQITDIYEDLARHASFSGILFHDDAVLTDFEDVSPEAVAAGGRRVWRTMPPRCPNVRKSARHGCVSKAKP